MKGTSMLPECNETNWYDEVEEVCQGVASGMMDSSEAMHRLRSLGYTSQDIIEDIIPDAFD